MSRSKNEVLKKGRFVFVILLFLVWAGLIVYKQVDLQFNQRNFLVQKKQEQQRGLVKLIPQRGMILDRNSKVLAISMDVDSIYAVPYEVDNPVSIAKVLSRKLSLGYKKVLTKLNSSKGFVWIKRKVRPFEARRIKNTGLKGIYTFKENKRYYPHGELASAAVGFAGIDNDGLSGIEYHYDSVLKGKPGAILTLKDARRKRMSTGQLIRSVPTRGDDLTLTIDGIVQYYLEEELFNASIKYKVKQSFAIIMQPYTGEILAIASFPAYDLNRFYIFSQQIHMNRAIQYAFEPGSTFKLVTAAAALEERVVDLDDKFYCENGSYKIADRVISDYKPFGRLSFRDIVVYSSNIGILKVGEKIGKEKFYKWMRRFGFGYKTGVDLPGENTGILRQTRKWSPDSLPSISFGQEISVNALQLLRFVSAIANGGYLVKPKINVNREISSESNEAPLRVMSERVRKSLIDIMVEVVERGTGKKARLPGYRVAGKTGTAQKIGKQGGSYLLNKYVASFVGFAPVSNPQIAMIVVMDEPVGLQDGGDVAAPVFAKVTTKVLRYIGSTRENENRIYQIPKTGDDESIQFLLTDFRKSNLSETILPVTDIRGSVNISSAGHGNDQSFFMPDLRGISYREVYEITKKLNLNPKFVGSGIANSQTPAAGKIVKHKDTCIIRFTRDIG